MISTITSWVLRHKRLVIGFWIVLTLVGGATSGAATKAMKQKFSVPGKEGWEANKEIAATFRGTGGNAAPLVPVVTLKGSAQAARGQLAGLEQKVRQALPGSRVAGYGSTGDKAFVSKNGHTAFVIAYAPPDPDQPFGDNPKAEKKLRAALRGASVAGAPVHLTGMDALQDQSNGGNNDGPGVLVEALVGGLGALIVLAFVFGSLLAIIPLFMAVPAILTTFLLVYGLTFLTDVSPIVQFLVALIGLGVAIDYSLLIVVRWREERTHGLDNEAAVARAMQTAGRAVVFSGTTVAIGLLALLALPLPFLRSVGYGGMLIPLVSVLVALTLLPAVLAKWGPRLDRRRLRSDDKASRSWTAWARLVVRNRWAAAGVSLLVLTLLLVAASKLQLGIANPDTLAKGGDARQGLSTLKQSGIGSGAMLPYETLAPAPEAAMAARSTARLDGIHGAVAPPGADWRGGGKGDVLTFQTQGGGSGPDLTGAVRDGAHGASPSSQVGGVVAQNSDFIDAVYGNFPLMIALIGVITFVLLARAFRSLVLPLKAVVLNVISVAAAWGVLQFVWQAGHGSKAIWGIDPTGAITAWIPLMLFAFLFGLSMDYEVFILSRVREEYDRTGDTTDAIVTGIGRTGRLVTSAAMILFLAFLSLASGPETDVKVMATGLAAGILLDATVVRALLVPALVSLFGRWNWWLPAWPARVLRVAPSEGT
ncbi:MAG TPA: MMPL family transporter [Thermoleophilaceae bacterium]|nr:MMPL family transporter [Thermoleophilaceae bacterium]